MTFKPRLGTIHLLVLLVILTCSQAQRSTAKQRFCLEPCLCHGDRISCKDADLEEIPTFATINGAHIVDLSKNNILTVVRQSFMWGGTIQLQYLLLSANAIVYVESGAFDDLLNLEHVDLSNNELQFVPIDFIAENGRMRFLNLAQNMLVHEVPIIMSDSLQVLDLSWNKLDTILPETFAYLPNLERLELQSNNFQYISTEIFQKIPNLMYIDLNINMWTCNCTTQLLFEFVTSQGLFNATAPIICRQNDSSINEIHLLDDDGKNNSFCNDRNETKPSVLLLGDNPETLLKGDIKLTVNDMSTILTVSDPSNLTVQKEKAISTHAKDPLKSIAKNAQISTNNEASGVIDNDPSILTANDLSIIKKANDPSISIVNDPSIVIPNDQSISTADDLSLIKMVNDPSISIVHDPSILTANDPSILTANDLSVIKMANDPSISIVHDSSILTANDLSVLTANDPSILTADDIAPLSPDVADIVQNKDTNSTNTRTITVYHVSYSMLNIINLIVFIFMMVFVAKMLVMCLDICRSLKNDRNTEESLLYKATQMQIV